jgi:hypothetical protein
MGDRFDAFTKQLAEHAPRRTVVLGLGGLTLASLGSLGLAGIAGAQDETSGDVEAEACHRRCRRRCRNRKPRCKERCINRICK